MAFNLIQLPCRCLEHGEDMFSWRLLVFTINSIEKSTAIIGRHSTCDFLISSSKLPCFLSRKHAKLTVIDKQLYIQDLNSTNGTFKNSVMLEPNLNYQLQHGDFIAFGSKGEETPTFGKNVKPQDTPFLFKVMEVKSQRENKVEKKDCDSTAQDAECDDSISFDEYSSSSAEKNKNPSTTSMHKRTMNLAPQIERKKRMLSQSNHGKSYDPTEVCSSVDCKVAGGDDGIVSWVQCDACDKWFHTVCVGCNYDEVKDTDRQFYCRYCEVVCID